VSPVCCETLHPLGHRSRRLQPVDESGIYESPLLLMRLGVYEVWLKYSVLLEEGQDRAGEAQLGYPPVTITTSL